MSKLKFNPEDWEEITDYLKKWDEWRRKRRVGRPDYSGDTIYLVPFTIALVESQKKIERLTLVLIGLTIVLVFIGAIEIIKYFGV